MLIKAHLTQHLWMVIRCRLIGAFIPSTGVRISNMYRKMFIRLMKTRRSVCCLPWGYRAPHASAEKETATNKQRRRLFLCGEFFSYISVVHNSSVHSLLVSPLSWWLTSSTSPSSHSLQCTIEHCYRRFPLKFSMKCSCHVSYRNVVIFVGWV